MKTIYFLPLLLLGCSSPGASSKERVALFGVSKPQQSMMVQKRPIVPPIEIDHRFLHIVFNPDFKNPDMVRYRLGASDLRARYIKRDIDPFDSDPFLKAYYPALALKKNDYKGSGYDRGHMVPAEDLTWNEDAFILTFSMANMVPQNGDLNSKSWRKLEDLARKIACGEKDVSIYTGPIYSSEFGRTEAGAAIPIKFFKVIVDESPPRKIISFVYAQEDVTAKPDERVVALSQIIAEVSPVVARSLPIGDDLDYQVKSQISDWMQGTCDPLVPQKSGKMLLKLRRRGAN